MAEPLDSMAPLRHADRCMAAIPEASSDDVDIMVDLHGRTPLPWPSSSVRCLRPHRPWFSGGALPPRKRRRHGRGGSGTPRHPHRNRGAPGDALPVPGVFERAPARWRSQTSLLAVSGRPGRSPRWPRPTTSRSHRITHSVQVATQRRRIHSLRLPPQLPHPGSHSLGRTLAR